MQVYGAEADETSECLLAWAKALIKMHNDEAAEPVMCQALKVYFNLLRNEREFFFLTRACGGQILAGNHGPTAAPVFEVQGLFFIISTAASIYSKQLNTQISAR